ncbi:MAG: LysR family transcriptional regulator [Myxococcota bacterium]
MHSWDDLQTIEALVRTGTVAGAGRALGLRHTTVSRRLDALERALETPLFVRGARLQPTALARDIAERAGRMAEVARDVEGLVAGARRTRAQRVVVTTNDVLAPLVFSAVARLGDGPRVEVRISDLEEALVPGVTDLALRPSSEPSGGLRGWRLGRLRIGVFGAKERRASSRWVQPTRELRGRASMRWLRAVPVAGDAVVECGSLISMRDACAAGLGRAVLPVLLGGADGRLALLDGVEGGVPVWLLASATRRRDVQLQVTATRLVGAMRAVRGAWE